MLYMLSLIDQEPNWEDVKPEEMQAMVDEMGRYNDELKEAGVMVDGHGLRERATASVVRFDENRETPVTDGPFAETKEAVGGFDLIEASSLEEAVEIAAGHPVAQSGTIEVRPLWGN